MSLPETQEEKLRAWEAQYCAGLAENLVSTACPGCRERFTTLARYVLRGLDDSTGVWLLRCTACGHRTEGELK
jgi:hypothetical protein